MPNHRPWSEYVHCNNNMLANLKHNASALFWYTQRYYRSKGHAPWITSKGYCAQPPRFKSQGTQASPPSSMCMVHAQGVKSWGGRFIHGYSVWLLKPWLAHQVRSSVAANPLESSTPSNHDNPQCACNRTFSLCDRASCCTASAACNTGLGWGCGPV